MDADTAVRLLRSGQLIAHTPSGAAETRRKSFATPSSIPSGSKFCSVRRKWPAPRPVNQSRQEATR
jgi:hypothetical protein